MSQNYTNYGILDGPKTKVIAWCRSCGKENRVVPVTRYTYSDNSGTCNDCFRRGRPPKLEYVKIAKQTVAYLEKEGVSDPAWKKAPFVVRPETPATLKK